jgi:hypothetical protein
VKRLSIATLIWLLAGALPAGATTPPERASCPPDIPRADFFDVYPLSPHAFDIDCIAWRSITRRESAFGPTEALPRWEMAAWLDGALGWVQDRYAGQPDTFTDTAGLDDSDSIEALRQLDVTRGIGDNRFDPYGAVPRWQMALFLTRTYEAAGNELPPATDHGFVDIGGSTGEAQVAINQLAGLGITRGTGPSTFSPDDLVTREQMASFVARLLERIWVLYPVATACVATALPITCSGDMVAVKAPTDLRLRIPMFMHAHIGSLELAKAALADPRTRIDILIDGAPIPVTSTLRRSTGTIYRYWEGRISADLDGPVTVESRTYVRGVLTTVRVVEVDLR